MPDTTQLATSYLEGIGPATAAALESIGIHTVADFFRASEQAISGAADGLASVETARRWRAMARLVEIEGVDHQLAEALADGGIHTTEQVRSRSAEELLGVFAAARADGKIPDVPSTERVTGIVLDATVLDLTGSLNGTVRDEDGVPVAGAQVRLGGGEWSTDERGRFRASRVALGQPHQLVIEREGFETAVVVDPPLVSDDATISVEVLTLAKAPEGSDSGDTTGDGGGELCEYEGDVLPPIAQHAMTTRAMGNQSLRDGDLLTYHRDYADEEHVQMASKFLRYEKGRYYTLHWRVKKGDLPGNPARGQTFLHRGGVFRRISMNPHRLRHLLALRGARKALAGSTHPKTSAGIDAAVDLYVQSLLSQLHGSEEEA